VLTQNLKITKPQEEIPAAFFASFYYVKNISIAVFTKLKKLDYQFSFLLDQKRNKKIKSYTSSSVKLVFEY
jgi:hypothetical protein